MILLEKHSKTLVCQGTTILAKWKNPRPAFRSRDVRLWVELKVKNLQNLSPLVAFFLHHVLHILPIYYSKLLDDISAVVLVVARATQKTYIRIHLATLLNGPGPQGPGSSTQPYQYTNLKSPLSAVGDMHSEKAWPTFSYRETWQKNNELPQIKTFSSGSCSRKEKMWPENHHCFWKA